MTGPKLFLTISIVCTACVLTAGAMAQEKGQERGPDTSMPDRAAAQPAPRYAGAVETTGSRIAAPVGHRQPTLKSLPDSARDIARPAVDPLGPLPQICNQC